MKLSKYFEMNGRGMMSLLAKKINSPIPDVSRWASGRRKVPIERCILIEQYTKGVVTRKDLRPDDWHLIWPELLDKVKQE